MTTRIKLINRMSLATSSFVIFSVVSAQAQTPARTLTGNSFSNRPEFRLDMFRLTAKGPTLSFRRAGVSLMPEVNAGINAGAMTSLAAGPGLQVLGSGTLGRLAKWTGFTGGNSIIGDSTIFEDKFGKVGIGTDAPTSKLTVAGMIETTLGGLKFPDGTTQTTAALSGLQSILHDATLQGNGTSGSPLGVSAPLNLTGADPIAILKITNTGNGSGLFVFSTHEIGALIRGGTSASGAGRTGLQSEGGTSTDSIGGIGVDASGGNSTTDVGGSGVAAVGGNSIFDVGGPGVSAVGGAGGSGGGSGISAIGQAAFGNSAGDGAFASGGSGNSGSGGFPGTGGVGLRAQGGLGIGAGGLAGDGIVAIRGIGIAGGVEGRAGFFGGDVEISGNLNVTGATKNFKIDHPLDPENKYLYHAAIESSEVLNIYSGNIRLDGNGEAVVALPDWFEALNRDFRYQLTAIGTPAQGLYIAQEIGSGSFRIAGGMAGLKVSWQVTGVRSDQAMRRHPFVVEQDKPERERGHYLQPELYNQPEERGVEWARNPEMMQRLKQQRIESEHTQKQRRQVNR